jgi:hypothetical protein
MSERTTTRMYTRYRTRRWLRWALLYVVGVLVLMVAGLVIEAAVSPGRQTPQALLPTAVPVPPWASAAPSPVTKRTEQSASAANAALVGPVQLVQGRELINGVYLGFPHSIAGAVSAATGFFTAIGSTLDPDRAAAVMRMIADPTYSDGPQQAADGAVNDRKDLGLPVSGPLPRGASLQVQPAEYQLRGVTPDQVTVLLLCDFTATVPGQGTQTRIGVFPVRLHWYAGDWKILAPGTANYAGLAAEPASPQAAGLGWQELEPPAGS